MSRSEPQVSRLRTLRSVAAGLLGLACLAQIITLTVIDPAWLRWVAASLTAIAAAALAAGVIREGHVWTDMLRQRNLLAHTYNLRHSDDALAAIESRYLAEMAQLHAWLAGKLQE